MLNGCTLGERRARVGVGARGRVVRGRERRDDVCILVLCQRRRGIAVYVVDYDVSGWLYSTYTLVAYLIPLVRDNEFGARD